MELFFFSIRPPTLWFQSIRIVRVGGGLSPGFGLEKSGKSGLCDARDPDFAEFAQDVEERSESNLDSAVRAWRSCG